MNATISLALFARARAKNAVRDLPILLVQPKQPTHTSWRQLNT